MNTATIVIIAGAIIIIILLIIGVVISSTGDRKIVEKRLGQYLDNDSENDSARPRLAGETSTDAPPPNVKKKKRKGKY